MEVPGPFYRKSTASFLLILAGLIIAIQFPIAFAGINTTDQDMDGYYLDPPSDSGVQPDPDDHNPCIPDENSEACKMSEDPIGAINDVMENVNNLISSGNFDINSAQAKSLLSKLQNAISYIESDKTKLAINNLNTFNNKINSFINSGDILPEDGQTLIFLVNNIINSLK